MDTPRVKLALALLAALLLAGCAGGPKALSQDAAEARVQAALSTLPTLMSTDPVDDGLRLLQVEITGVPDGEEFGLGNVDLSIEWGRGGVTHATLSTQSGAISVKFEVYCGPTGTTLVWGEDAYASRPSVGDDPCSELDEADGGAGLFDEVLGEDLDLDEAVVTPNKDGTVTAVLTRPEGTLTLQLDARGRLDRLDFEGAGEEAGASGSMQFTYGARREIDIPEADHLIPATLETRESFEAGTLTVVVEQSDQEPALGEMEVRVTDGYDGPVLASFPLTQSSGSASGITFSFSDADADGRLSAGDSYTLSSQAWQHEWDVDQVVYDVLADGEVNGSPLGMPGLGPLGLVLALGAALAVSLRRR